MQSVAFDPFTNETLIQHDDGSQEWIPSQLFKEYVQGHHTLFEEIRQKIRFGLMSLQQASFKLKELGITKDIMSNTEVLEYLNLDDYTEYIPQSEFYTIDNNGKDLVKHSSNGNSLRLSFKSYDNLIKYCYKNKIVLLVGDFMSEEEAEQQYQSSLVDFAVNI